MKSAFSTLFCIKNNAIYLLLLLALVQACKTPAPPRDPRPQNACNYANALNALHDSLISSRSQIAQAYEQKSIPKILAAEKLFKEKLKQTHDSIAQFPNFESDSTLKIAWLNLLDTYQNQINRWIGIRGIILTEDAVDTIANPNLPDINPETDTLDPNDALIPKYEVIEKRIRREEQNALIQLDSVQQNFARKYNFLL
ncbi:MAG: hypothetical protein ACRCYO_03735, partial [Bacteroidia bacterium]